MAQASRPAGQQAEQLGQGIEQHGVNSVMG